MATNIELEKQVKDLAAKYDALAARFEAVIVATSPPCYACGKPAVARKRIYLGRIRMAQDVWTCAACQGKDCTNAT
jgi:ribosomal protein L37AE/L43A